MEVMTTELRGRRTQERRVDRRLRKVGQKLWRVNHRSRYSNQYGPYAVIDVNTNGIVAYGCDLDQLEQEIAQEQAG